MKRRLLVFNKSRSLSAGATEELSKFEGLSEDVKKRVGLTSESWVWIPNEWAETKAPNCPTSAAARVSPVAESGVKV